MNISVISSSIREGSSTRRVAIHLFEKLKQEGKCNPDLIDLTNYEYPIWKEVFHLETNPPDECIELHDKLIGADAMIFVTPEYNGSYSLALKNMVDYYGVKVFEKKAVGVSSVTVGSLGGIRAGIQLQQLVLAIYAHPAPQMLLVPKVQECFDENGNLLDPTFEKNISLFLREFLWLAEALNGKNESGHLPK